MQQIHNLQGLLAQINSGQVQQKAGDAAKPDAEKKKKAPAKPRAPKAGGAAGAQGKGSALKGATTGYTPAPKPATTANVLAASAAPGITAAFDPSSAPLGKRVKDVLDYLLQNTGSNVTPAQIKQATGLDLATDAGLLREVHKHPRMKYDQRTGTAAPGGPAVAAWYAYNPEIQGVYNKITLLNHVRDNKGPAVLAESLRRCYLRAAEDLAELKREGKIFIIGHPDPSKETVFMRDDMGQDIVQDDVRALWFEVCQEHVKDHVPRGVQELKAAVMKAGLSSALDKQKIERAAPGGPRERVRKPRQQRFNIDKATNAHLPFLFSGAQPKNIDS